jgi:hypothetical protein
LELSQAIDYRGRLTLPLSRRPSSRNFFSKENEEKRTARVRVRRGARACCGAKCAVSCVSAIATHFAMEPIITTARSRWELSFPHKIDAHPREKHQMSLGTILLIILVIILLGGFSGFGGGPFYGTGYYGGGGLGLVIVVILVLVLLGRF